MDLDFLLVVIMVVLTTAITGLTVNGVVRQVLSYKRDKNMILARGHHSNAADVTSVQERTSHIEDRLKVLERIATDPEARRGADLAQEIEQLRLNRETEAG